jgi:hypothetical protein
LSETVLKQKGQKLSFLKNFGTSWGFIPGEDSLAFVDNHDNQRGHGGGGQILTFFESRLYKIANAFMMAWPYAFVQVMSSFNFVKSQDWQGPPSNGKLKLIFKSQINKFIHIYLNNLTRRRYQRRYCECR